MLDSTTRSFLVYKSEVPLLTTWVNQHPYEEDTAGIRWNYVSWRRLNPEPGLQGDLAVGSLADYFSVKERPAAASGSSMYTLENT